MKKRVIKLIVIYAVVLSILGVYAIIYFTFGIGFPCVFNLVTGLNCPGCGNSRAVHALAELRFADALHCNYLFPLEFAYIAYLVIYISAAYLRTGRRDLMPKPEWLNIAALSVILAWWVIRNILGV